MDMEWNKKDFPSVYIAYNYQKVKILTEPLNVVSAKGERLPWKSGQTWICLARKFGE